MRILRTAAALAAVVSSASALTACGSTTDSEAAEVADEFHAALVDREWSAACAMLAPATRSELKQSSGKACAKAIVAERLPTPTNPESTDVFDTAAAVQYPGETVFLTRFDDGWKVIAAGCKPRSPHPYDCTISGG